MRRFVVLVFLSLFALPLGLSVAGCGRKATTQYCNGAGYGPVYGQVKTITLASNLTATGESLNYGQIGTALSATSADCVGSSVSISNYSYGTTDMSIADVNPTNGSVCGGTWNRNSGGGIADYTVCTPPPATNTKHVAYITASAAGATSNPIAVYIHAPVTSVILGGPTSNCSTSNDPGTDCFQTSTTGTTVTAPPYNGTRCLSQGTSGLLIARVYSNGDTLPAHNITAQVGPVSFALQGSTNIATINAQGVATANQPGSALVTATVSNSSSALNSGFISTCPPAAIKLTAVNQDPNATNITVGLNSAQSFSAVVTDTNGVTLTGVQLEFNSTLPANFPASSASVTPVYPGSSTITAQCQPSTCNPAPFSQIGYLGNGKPITSNGITVTAAGTASSVLYMASTSSQYIESIDFTTGQLSSPLKLPYVPNSMVISQDGSTLYLGSSQGLMVVAATTNALTSVYPNVQGTVLAVSPSSTYVVTTDPSRNTVSLITSSGSIFSSFNGVGTHAQWTPDSSTLYVTTAGNGGAGQLLTYSTFVGWQTTSIAQSQYNDVAVTVPSVGAYFAGSTTEGRSYCPSTTLGAGSPPAASNLFSPVADVKAVQTDRLAATTDGKHILGAAVVGNAAQVADIAVNLTAARACPQGTVSNNYFTSTLTTTPVGTAQPTAITGVIPASNSAEAVVTYTGTGSVLPVYVPASSGAGSIRNVTLSSGAVAPVAGVFSTDNTTFYAGTTGDNQVHIITFGTGGNGTDTGVITPKLLDPNGTVVTPNLIAQRPRRTTS